MFKNESIMEQVFKSNEIVIDNGENADKSVLKIDDNTPVYLELYVVSPSRMLVNVQAALLSVMFITDNSDGGEFVVFCNAKYDDIKGTKAFTGNYTIHKAMDAPDGTIYSFGALKKMVQDGLISADKHLDFNIGIITEDTYGHPYPLNEEFVDVTRISPSKDSVTLVYNARDIVAYEMEASKHGEAIREESNEVGEELHAMTGTDEVDVIDVPADEIVEISGDPAMPVDADVEVVDADDVDMIIEDDPEAPVIKNEMSPE